MNNQEALDIRLAQRKKYLEDPYFERLSDIIIDEWECFSKRDNYIFAYLLCGPDEKPRGNYHSYVELEQLFLAKYKRKNINWNGIYQYCQERKKSIDRGEWNATLNFNHSKTETDVSMVLKLLEKHKNKILTTYKTF